MTSFSTGARLDVAVLGLPGRWTVWSKAADAPGAYFVVPADDEAHDLGLKVAVIKAVMGRSASQPALQLIRTDPPRNDLVQADLDRRNREKRAS